MAILAYSLGHVTQQAHNRCHIYRADNTCANELQVGQLLNLKDKVLGIAGSRTSINPEKHHEKGKAASGFEQIKLSFVHLTWEQHIFTLAHKK